MDTERNPHALWKLRLYVAGQTPKSLLAISNLKRFVEKHLKHQCHVEVIDVLKDPASAREDDIIAIPSLVRKNPQPQIKLVGDLSAEGDLLKGLRVSALPSGE